MLIAGIDEAGYGPLLGPLVITGVSMKIPDELEGLSLWELFSDAISRNTKQNKGKFIVADSKKLFRKSSKRNGICELERSALGITILAEKETDRKTQFCPENLNAFLKLISLEPECNLQDKWYARSTLKLPVEVDRQGLMLAVNIFERELRAVSAEIAGVYTVPLIERQYNRFAKLMKNKAQILFSQTARIIARIISQSNERRIRIFIDKQGGRNSYTNNLLKFFSQWQLRILKESDEQSVYVLANNNRAIEISFTKNGEQYNLLTAWASIVSKYVRELFMIQFNNYWLGLDKRLKPTAGYWQDGQRFVRDILPLMKRMNIKEDELIRQL